ncbi:PBECR2 nuclease fold domain-containing protein, partial [Campylobacter upsaliensis]|uniref:PBECR2 nuclease fold domain-containing protein n=1 Tax=Campylobacter upsaliensis TaxID=28080 RepID=UPI00214A451C
LLEHKKELKTRELLNFLEQSALNGKEKAFLMRHLERDLDKIKEKETKASEDIIFTDTKGKEHTLSKEAREQWLEAFNLKSLDEAYIPNFTPEAKQALDSILQGEVIKLYAGSLVKLIKENRLKYLDRIKPTLEQPQRIILQNDGALIFARNFGEEKYFTSVARNDNGEWIIRSNAPKAENGLNNKISAGGKEIYNSQAANQINAHNPYDDIAKSNIKLD